MTVRFVSEEMSFVFFSEFIPHRTCADTYIEGSGKRLWSFAFLHFFLSNSKKPRYPNLLLFILSHLANLIFSFNQYRPSTAWGRLDNKITVPSNCSVCLGPVVCHRCSLWSSVNSPLRSKKQNKIRGFWTPKHWFLHIETKIEIPNRLSKNETETSLSKTST